MGAWPYVVWQCEPRVSRNLILCPAAVQPVIIGGRYPFAAWYSDYDDVPVCGSYTVNFWLANQGDYDWKFWGTTNTRYAASVPLLADGNWKDAEPEPTDDPWETREQMVAWGWQPNQNEIKRVCIDRHGPAVNMVFLDFSVRKVGLKELWLLKWHRRWPEGHDHLPVWPEWMQNFEDPE
jgi:prepilin-type processing-associated H-X9-DG protein